MVPADLKDFMTVCVGSAASFIGLLFVGLSVVMQGDKKLAKTDRILAEGSYTALVNIFFVCLFGTIATQNIDVVSIVMAITGLLNCFRLRTYGKIRPLMLSVTVYLIELIFGINLLLHPHKYFNEGVFEYIIIFLFVNGLVRAWSLTGIRSERKDQ